MTEQERERARSRREPVNVREELVGHDGAERLDVETDRRTALATMVLGGVMVVLAIAVLVQAARLDNRGESFGPATAPWVLGSLLFVVGVLVVVRGRRDMGVWEASEHTTGQDWVRMLSLLGVLVAYAIVIPFLGYVVSSTLLFGSTAILLGAPNRLRAFAYGWCVAALVFLAFDIGIGLALPGGPWGF